MQNKDSKSIVFFILFMFVSNPLYVITQRIENLGTVLFVMYFVIRKKQKQQPTF